MSKFFARSAADRSNNAPYVDMVMAYINEAYHIDFAGLTSYFEGYNDASSLAAWKAFQGQPQLMRQFRTSFLILV
jgi:hypothetical protein